MIKKIFTKNLQHFLPFILYLFSVSCQGPLAGEQIEFVTPNVYKDLSPEATRIVMKTKKSNWTFQDVQYNDTTVNLSTGNIYKIDHGKVTDPSFSYNEKAINNTLRTEIKGSFFSITSENPKSNDGEKIITIDITENRSKEKRVLLVRLLNLDTGSYFSIEQNPK